MLASLNNENRAHYEQLPVHTVYQGKGVTQRH